MTHSEPGCPLCGSTDGRELARVAYSDIFRGMEAMVGIRFSADVMSRHAPSREVGCRRCTRCGLDWFQPAVAGDASFYQELSSGRYYETQRWEFHEVAARLDAADAVADFGCGAGAFLRLVRSRVRRAVGVDHSAYAVSALQEAGIEASNLDFADFSQQNAGTFDVVTAFQTLEHVDDVMTLLDPAIRCLRPGGRLFLSVPNRERYAQAELEALDWPPHHLSRWSSRQVPELALRCGLQVVRTVTEPPDLSTGAQYVQGEIERRVQPVLRSAARPAARLARRAVLGSRTHEMLASRGAYERRGVHGHTMLAELAKP